MMGQESRKVKAILSYLKEVLLDPNLIISGQHKSCCIQEDCIFAVDCYTERVDLQR